MAEKVNRPMPVRKGKVVMKECGNPKAAAMLKENGQKIVLGKIIGIATDIVERSKPDGSGEKFLGMGGTFEAIPADESLPCVQSGICYLPDWVQNQMLEVLGARNDKGERLTANVSFAFEVSSVKATNPQGYSWELTALTEPGQTVDPLKELRNQAAKAKALPAPEKGKAA